MLRIAERRKIKREAELFVVKIVDFSWRVSLGVLVCNGFCAQL